MSDNTGKNPGTEEDLANLVKQRETARKELAEAKAVIEELRGYKETAESEREARDLKKQEEDREYEKIKGENAVAMRKQKTGYEAQIKDLTDKAAEAAITSKLSELIEAHPREVVGVADMIKLSRDKFTIDADGSLISEFGDPGVVMGEFLESRPQNVSAALKGSESSVNPKASKGEARSYKKAMDDPAYLEEWRKEDLAGFEAAESADF